MENGEIYFGQLKHHLQWIICFLVIFQISYLSVLRLKINTSAYHCLFACLWSYESHLASSPTSLPPLVPLHSKVPPFPGSCENDDYEAWASYIQSRLCYVGYACTNNRSSSKTCWQCRIHFFLTRVPIPSAAPNLALDMTGFNCWIFYPVRCWGLALLWLCPRCLSVCTFSSVTLLQHLAKRPATRFVEPDLQRPLSAALQSLAFFLCALLSSGWHSKEPNRPLQSHSQRPFKRTIVICFPVGISEDLAG